MRGHTLCRAAFSPASRTVLQLRQTSASARRSASPTRAPLLKRRHSSGPSPASAMSAPGDRPPKITLTAKEESVRKILVDVAARIDAERAGKEEYKDEESLTLRFTGGWVRDKLLGTDSHDIDVGISKMTGFDFGKCLSEFLREQHGISVRSVHKIESNPEKSKHLETATTKILGLDIDLVNLRSETYSKDSRIPQMEFGTPVQDALRRDACVNALFYNLHTQQVEDFTGRGLQDMKEKLIRTPLPPHQTFDDDPLRVLRLIRFASRLDFTIVPEAREAMRNPDIKKALRLKISRERVGIEIEKMLRGKNPHLALLEIYALSLFESIFAPPLEMLPELPTSNLSIATSILYHLHHLPNSSHYRVLPKILLKTPQERYTGWLIAALTPWESYVFPGVDTKKGMPGAATAAREGLRADNKIYATLASSFRNFIYVQEWVDANSAAKTPRGEAGMFVRKLGADWRSQYLCALLLESIPIAKKNFSQGAGGLTGIDKEVEVVIEKYAAVLNFKIAGQDLLDAHTFKPVVNGKELLGLLGQKKAGPWMTTALNSLMHWQLDNPGAEKAQVEEWVRASKEELVTI